MPTNKPDLENSTMNFATGRFAIGSGRESLENARKALATVRGRPRKGIKSEGSRVRSLRLPDATWADLEALAKEKGMTIHRLLRVIIAERLYTQTWSERQGSKRPATKGVTKPRHPKARHDVDAAQ